MLHLCKDKDYAVPALASAYTLAVSQAAKRFRVRAHGLRCQLKWQVHA